MVEQYRRNRPVQWLGPRQMHGHRLEPVEIQIPRFERVPVALCFVALLAGNRPLAIGQISEERVELLAPVVSARNMPRFSCSVHYFFCLAEMSHARSLTFRAVDRSNDLRTKPDRLATYVTTHTHAMTQSATERLIGGLLAE
jgi:hypothetical protein